MGLTTLTVGKKITAQDTTNRIKDSNITTTGTLVAANWVSSTFENQICYYYKLSNTNITATSIIEISSPSSATYAQRLALRNCFLTYKSQGNGYIELWNFGEVPMINIPIELVIRKDTTSL